MLVNFTQKIFVIFIISFFFSINFIIQIPQHIVKYLAEAFQTQGVPAQQQFEEEKEKEIPRETQIPVQKEKESQIQPQKEIQKEKHTLNELPFFKKTNFKKNVPMKSPPAADGFIFFFCLATNFKLTMILIQKLDRERRYCHRC